MGSCPGPPVLQALSRIFSGSAFTLPYSFTALQGVDKDLKNLEPVVRQTIVKWGIWSPALEAMIRNTQQFASRTFTPPKARLLSPPRSCVGITHVSASHILMLCRALQRTPSTCYDLLCGELCGRQ